MNNFSCILHMRRKIIKNNKHIQKNEKEQTNKMNKQQQLEFGKKLLKRMDEDTKSRENFLSGRNAN